MDLLSLEWRITYDNFIWNEFDGLAYASIWSRSGWPSELVIGKSPVIFLVRSTRIFSEFARVILTRICNRKQSEVQFLFSERSEIYQVARGYQVV